MQKKRIGNSTYWHSKAGGKDVYFGNVNDVRYKDARSQFSEYAKSLSDGTVRNNRLSTVDLMELFLAWIKEKRSPRTFDQRQRDCNRFANFKIARGKIAELPATSIRGDDLEAWLTHCREQLGESPQTLLHRQTSIKHCWNWGAKNPSPASHLPPTFRPFAAVEKIHIPRKVLAESELLTDGEVQILIKAARIDLDQFHRFGPKQPRKQNPYERFSDMLQAYYHTGARTGELAAIRVGDVQLRTKQVTLGEHKTSRTQREQRVRTMTLNKTAMTIFRRHCTGKHKDDRVFTTSDGKPWNPRSSLPSRFVRIKEAAQELGLGDVREHITIYDFRHLWISEMLMARNDIATVARMAGTSVSMIERVYGHFRNEHLQAAQARMDALRKQRAQSS